MSSYRQILYHSVISTKDRKLTIPDHQCEALYRYIWGVVKNSDCTLYQINGIGDHIHLLTDLNPTLSLSNFIKNIKVATHGYCCSGSKDLENENDFFSHSVNGNSELKIGIYLKKPGGLHQ